MNQRSGVAIGAKLSCTVLGDSSLERPCFGIPRIHFKAIRVTARRRLPVSGDAQCSYRDAGIRASIRRTAVTRAAVRGHLTQTLVL